jgi:ribulose 1,5-bisphosphate synthetase/thiazole synthase
MTTHHAEPTTRTGSLWTTTTELPVFPQLHDDLRVDACIVGGGIAGLSIAYLLTRAGKPCSTTVHSRTA